MTTGGRVWWWWWWAVSFVVLFGRSALALLYTARLPLRYGTEGHRLYETMSYKRRLLAGSTLWVVSPVLWPCLAYHIIGTAVY